MNIQALLPRLPPPSTLSIRDDNVPAEELVAASVTVLWCYGNPYFSQVMMRIHDLMIFYS